MSINKYIDATNLKPDATQIEIDLLCMLAIQNQFAAVCVAPTFVAYIAPILANSTVNVCTVIGFPNGYATSEVKLYETEQMIAQGAQEIDFVLNRTYLKSENFDAIEYESKLLVDYCKSKNVISKWIIESSAIEEKELLKLCEIANKINPDYVKTCTGFFGSARLEDVRTMRKALHSSIKIKASGGIKTLEQATEFIESGADRLGTSTFVGWNG